jgi:hypothetical protein
MQGWNLKWRIKRDRHPNRQCESHVTAFNPVLLNSSSRYKAAKKKQLTAARSTAIVQSSGSTLPVMTAAEIAIAAIPHIKVIARLIK